MKNINANELIIPKMQAQITKFLCLIPLFVIVGEKNKIIETMNEPKPMYSNIIFFAKLKLFYQ